MILFLDVDGVLNNNEIILTEGAYALGTNQLLALKHLVDGLKCDIVLSSTWRMYDKCLKTLKKAFKEHNIPLWIDATPQLGTLPRRHEIKEWLKQNGQKKCIIIDDDIDAFFKEAVCIHTDYKVGLTMELVEECLSVKH